MNNQKFDCVDYTGNQLSWGGRVEVEIKRERGKRREGSLYITCHCTQHFTIYALTIRSSVATWIR